MSATNYARRGGGKSRTPLEIRFFHDGDEIPRSMIEDATWVWWRVPRDFVEVQLVGETRDDWSKRQSRRRGNGGMVS